MFDETLCFPAYRQTFAETVYRAINWLLDHQNRDGTWGKTQKEKIRWTSHALIVLALAGFDRDSSYVARPLSWLKSLQYEVEEWYARIPALCALREEKWLQSSGDLDYFLELMARGAVHELFMWQMPITLHLQQLGYSVPHESIIEQALARKIEYGENIWTIQNKANYTALTALYLSEIDHVRYDKGISNFTNWLVSSHIDEDGSVSWERSISITSYVLIDLVQMGLHKDPNIRDLIVQGLSFFHPTSDGNMPPDRHSAKAFESQETIYTTIMAIHAFLEVYFRQGCLLPIIIALSIDKARVSGKPLSSKLIGFFKRYWRPLATFALGILLFLSLSWLLYTRFGIDLVVSTVVSVFMSTILALVMESFAGTRKK